MESFPHNEQSREHVRSLMQIIEDEFDPEFYDISLMEIIRQAMPKEEAERRTRHFTESEIAKALVKWALQTDIAGSGVRNDDSLPKVLDPSAGTGVFINTAFIDLLRQNQVSTQQEVLDHLFAVDTDSFPLQLTAIWLALRDPTEQIHELNVFNKSFFDIDAPASEPDDSDIGLVDAVVGNPPYIQSGDLYPDKRHFREHLENFGPDGASPYLKGEKRINKRADAYVYFITHATEFLRDGGRLAFIIPTKWMNTEYGAQLQQFVFDHYKLKATVGFDVSVFDDVQVDTSLILLEKCDNGAQRSENVAKFIQFRNEPNAETILEAVNGQDDSGIESYSVTESSDQHRTLSVYQSYLETATDNGKIGQYLIAPRELLDIFDAPELVPLGEMADVIRGAMTGLDDFFFPDKEALDSFGIEEDFLLPGLKSVADFEGISYEEADVDLWFVNLHDFVESVRARSDTDPDGESLVSEVKETLEQEGYTGLHSWIQTAESNDQHLGTTVQRREVWFDFGEPPQPEIILKKQMRERFLIFFNSVRAVPNNSVDCIDPHSDVCSKALFGVLHSSLAQSIMEVWGRREGGMLQMMTGNTRSLPLPDVRSMTEDETRAIENVVDEIVKRGQVELSNSHRDQLDEVVLEATNLQISVNRIQEIQSNLLDRRASSE